MIEKSNQIEFKFIFNYYYVYEKSIENIIEFLQRIHNLLNCSKHRMYFSINMKHDY